MITYLLIVHSLWALYAYFVNRGINERNGADVPWQKDVAVFIINFALCPVAIGFAVYNEYNGQEVLFTPSS